MNESQKPFFRGSSKSKRCPYDVLFALAGSPVVAVNRALAIAEMHGASVALDALPEVATDERLAEYQPYWAARAELLARTVHMMKPATHTKSQSVSSAIPQSAASCSSACQPCHRDS